MRLITNVLIIISFLLFGSQFMQAQCDGTSDIIQNSRNLELTTTTNINVGMGNSFTAPCSGVIEGVSFWTYRVPGTIGQTSVTVELYRNPFSSSRVLMSTYTTDISFQNEGSRERYFPFENTPSLVAGTVYGVRFINNEAGQIIDLDLHTGNLLAGGNMFVNNFDLSSPWSTRDLRFQIHYEDNVAPIARCRNITRALGANGTVSISTGNINNNSTDADSGIASFFLSENTFDCSNIGENTVTLTVRDQNGNIDVCQATVTITDESDPVITCPADITVFTDPGVPIAVPYTAPTYDDCSYAAPDGFTFLGAWEGKYFYLSDNTIQIDQAFAQAELLGGHVATIVSAEHNSFIRTAVDNIQGATNAEVLIGYNDVATEDTFVWHDGNTTANFENWAVIEPNNAGGNEDYTVIKSGSVAKWNDVRGTTIRRYILQLSPALTQTSGFASGDFFPAGTTTNTFEATDAFGNTGTCSFDVTVIENPFETLVELSNGKLTITDIETNSDDQITLSNDGTTLTISNLIIPTVSGGPTLLNATTVTVQLADITNGIEFVGGNGDNTISFTDNISLTGINNGITLNDIKGFSQGVLIDIEGDFTINGNPGGTISLFSMNARNLAISGVDRVNDAGFTEMNISGTTTLQTIFNINLNSGVTNNTQFGGLITITASNVFFSSRGDATFGAVTTTGTDSSINNGLQVMQGNLTLAGPVQTAGDSNLRLRALGGNLIEQTASGTITTNRLGLTGNTAGTTNVTLNAANNDISTLQANEQARPIATCNFTDINTTELDQIYVNELLLTANTIEISENTELNINGAGTSTFNGNIDVTSTSATTSSIINHNAGTLNFSGTTLNLQGKLAYNGVSGTTTQLNGDISLPFGGPDVSVTFGTLEVEGPIFIGDTNITILDDATFSESTTLIQGIGTLSGGPSIVKKDAVIQPGGATGTDTLTMTDVEINGGTFAPLIDSHTSHDKLKIIGAITLADATFNPITNLGTIGNSPILLIDNDGTDAFVGTYNNYPEGSTIQIGSYIGVISYVGGDGNDMTLTALETTVELFQGKLEIVDVNGGVSDDQITFSNDGTTLTISNLIAPVTVTGGPTLSSPTSITIPLANITNGIEFVSGGGSNSVSIQNDLTLNGATNSLILNNLGGYNQTGALTIEGNLEILGNGTIDIILNEVTAGSLLVNNNASIIDSGAPITVTGTTALASTGGITIDQGQGNHQFDGIINIDAKSVTFTAGANTTFGTITTTVPILGDAPSFNYLAVAPGTIDFSDTVSIPGSDDIDSQLYIYGTESITQSGGSIATDFLVLYGNGATIATLDRDNALRAITCVNPFNANNVGVASVTVNSTTAIFLEEIIVNEFNFTSPIIRTFPDFTNISKNGSGESFLNGNVYVQNGTSNTGTGLIEHNNGTITINGDTIDLTGRITYNGAAGTITNLNGANIRLPFVTDNANLTFGTLNANNNVNIGDDTITILDEVSFSGAATVVNGAATFSGGNTIISDAATIIPGTSNLVASVTTSNLEITNATYAPRIDSDASYDNLSVVGSVMLSNATLSPTEGFVSAVDDTSIMLISNDGIDPVIGTFNNLPEGSGIQFGPYLGMISYVGGDGNDVVLLPDTVNPIALCQDLNFAIGLDGITINATQIDNGSSDNAGIASILVNGQSQIDYTYEDLGSHAVTLTVTDTSGNTAECMATITLTSSVTFPILISEYQPQTIISSTNQTIEIKGEPGETFLGVFVVIENDSDAANEGLVLSADTISDTFNPDGLLVASIPNIDDPSHTVVLTTSFSGTAGVTNVSAGGSEDRNSNSVDLSTFGIILDAVGVGDGGACCPVDSTMGFAFGGVDLPSIGSVPTAIFRSASTGEFFQLQPNGDIHDPNGAIVDVSLFDTTPTNDGTFGQINPTISINMNASAFITTWKTDNVGNSADNQITIYTDSNETYNYNIDWGDGTSNTNVTGNLTHTYSTAGTYTIGIVGTFPKFVSNGRFSGDALKLVTVDQWGSIAWNSFDSAFFECRNMDVVATDVPDLSNVTSLYNMFTDCQALVGNATFNTWDVSNIQTMQLMFSSALNFNQPLNSWNVSNVTNMASMFNTAEKFNQDLNNWNTSQVQFMDFMFLGALDFNGNISNWNVANVTNMDSMFSSATIFNGNISTWNTGEVTDMTGMFFYATAFEGTGGLNSWNVTKVEKMGSMFRHAEAFNQDLNNWNVSDVTYMNSMFWGAIVFNGNVSNWDITGLTSLDYVFYNATAFNGDLSQWNVSNIESLNSTFYGASSFNTDLNNWNVSNVTTMHGLFDGASSFNKPLDTWDVSNVTFMYRMFYNATNFNQDVSSWDVSLNQSFSEMFLNTSMSVENYDRLLIAWADLTLRNNLQFGISSEYCLGAEAKQYIIDTFNWSFTDDGLDANCTARFVTTWETTTNNETITIPTFSGETYNYAVNWGDGTVETGLTSNATHTYTTSGTHTVLITGTFPRIYFNNAGDRLKLQTIEQWGTNAWTSMENAFAGCENLDITATDIPDLSNVTDMTSMFEGASTLNIDISSWDVSNVTVMDRMLYGTTLFDQDLGDWNISNVTSMDDMLTNAMLSTVNYDNTLIGWRTLDTGETQIPTGVTFSGGDSAFCQSDYEREELIHTYNWTITDAGKTPDCTNRRFITTWKTESNNERITIPTNGGGYNYLVDWGDGNVDIDVSGNAVHTYATAGTYTVSITGDFPRIHFGNNHNTQIQSIDQWGSNQWDSMLRAFSTCRNLDVVATDTPDLSNVTNMGRMFFSCTSLVGNEHFDNWDVSRVNNFGSTFQGASSFNQPLNNWDVSRAIKLTDMFSGATSFDQSLADWDLSSLLNSGVANAARMFEGVILSTENYDATLIGWATLEPGETRIPSPVTFGGGNSQYCLSDTQRQTLIDTYGWTITDGGLNCGVKISPKVYLQGAALNPNVGEENLMRDDLRVAGFIPTRTPYTDMISCETTVFDITGTDAIVDWVWVELRDENDNTNVIAAQSALLQRDGDVVSTDGTSPLSFDAASSNYFISIQHRNHLGIMSLNAVTLNTVAVSIDFTNGATPTFGSNAQTTFGMPSGITGMWTGNANGDTVVQYSGVTPDTPDILSEILNDPGNFLNFPTYAVSGYKSYDINMDGNTQYSGTNPDTPVILQNVLAHPGNFLNFSTYQIIEQLPNTNN